jgi:hypothetical protein
MIVRRRPLIFILVIGIGLVAAPAIFQMFTRAPKGGQMITEFRPFMTRERLGAFNGYLDEIDDAHREARTLAVGDEGPLRDWVNGWPAIYRDMTGMLQDIVENIDNFAAVDALPPFVLFPWFFVLPGLIIAVVAFVTLRSPSRRRIGFLAIMGLGLIAAPAIFQMFTRAPLGAEMIDDFRPLMREKRVTQIQGHFLVIAGGEGALRTDVLSERELGGDLPAIGRFADEWPRISREMAPMIGAMADNVDNFAAVAALPPFWLFPWFFVLPGVMVFVAALVAFRRMPAAAAVASATEEVRA